MSKRFDRRHFLAGMGAAVTAASVHGFSLAQAAKKRPNVLLVTLDDLGLEVGCYGDRKAKTPYMDALAAQGVRFTRAYCTQASCSPSRGSMLTGLYPHQNGQFGLTPTFSVHDGTPLLPAVLKGHGYRTGAIGKIHVGPEEAVGFDWRGVDAKTTRHVRKVAASASEFFAQGDKPFFLMVNYSEPHRPAVQDIQKNFTQYNQVDGLPEKPYQPGEVPIPHYFGVDSPEIQADVSGYYNSIMRSDTGIGLLLEELAKAGMADNTLVILVSDQGPGFTRCKTTSYEAGIRIPLIIRQPGEAKGLVRNEMVSTVDLVPTIMDYVGISFPGPTAGRSLAPLLNEGDVPWREYLFTDYNAHGSWGQFYPRRTVRDGRFKLIQNLLPQRENPVRQLTGCSAWDVSREDRYDGTIIRDAYNRCLLPPALELYDLEKDRWEFYDLSQNPEYAEVRARLYQVLQDWRGETKDPLLDCATLEEMEEKLMSSPQYQQQLEQRREERSWR
ncbi:sulfatase [bacterium]|nr:sulfatase [bacterium]